MQGQSHGGHGSGGQGYYYVDSSSCDNGGSTNWSQHSTQAHSAPQPQSHSTPSTTYPQSQQSNQPAYSYRAPPPPVSGGSNMGQSPRNHPSSNSAGPPMNPIPVRVQPAVPTPSGGSSPRSSAGNPPTGTGGVNMGGPTNLGPQPVGGSGGGGESRGSGGSSPPQGHTSLEDAVAQAKTALFNRLSPLQTSDTPDFTVTGHNGRLEVCFPYRSSKAFQQILTAVCEATAADSAGHNSQTRPEVCVNILQHRFLVVRIKRPHGAISGPLYRLEVMIPMDSEGNGLVMADPGYFGPAEVNLCEKLYRCGTGYSLEGKGGKEEAATTSNEKMEKIIEKLRGLGVDVLVPKDEEESEEREPKRRKSGDDSKDSKHRSKDKKKSKSDHGSVPPEFEKRKRCAESASSAALWASIAGYDAVKGAVKQSITLPLVRPDLFQRMAELTRTSGGAKKTSGVLFTGPPGVGKTSMAKVAAHVAGMPLVYVPVESVVSKWYGEAEQKLRSVFEYTRQLGSAVLFLDELDAFAGNRDANMHEVTRRLLSVLLRQLDGLETDESGSTGKSSNASHIVLVGATNRVQDLDAALRSRFNKIIDFPLPDERTRIEIFSAYAARMQPAELAQLAQHSHMFSCRDIRECCDDAEHLFVAELLEQGGFGLAVEMLEPPPYKAYLRAVLSRNVM